MSYRLMLAPLVLALLAAAPVFAAASPRAADTVVVFPFELLDSSQEGEFVPKVRPEETKRLALLTDDLARRLTETGHFDLVPVGELAGAIKDAAPLHKCNGCEVDLAKKSGAKYAMLGLVQKFSDTLLSVSIQVVDAQSGGIKSFSAGVQGNTDEAWLRGVSYLVRNRLAIDGTSMKETAP
jgi:hypothetical protein